MRSREQEDESLQEAVGVVVGAVRAVGAVGAVGVGDVAVGAAKGSFRSRRR
jgi:hypothetical protein